MKVGKLTIIASSIALSAAAQAYQGEIEVGYTDGEVDVIDTEGYRLSGTYYFAPVDASKGPLAEAAFLDRASGVAVDLSWGELSAFGGDADTDGQSIGLNYVFANETFVTAGYATSDLEDVLEVDVTSIGVGKYLGDATLALNYALIEAEIEEDGDEWEVEADSWSLDYKLVIPGDVSYGLDASVVYTDPDVDGADSTTGYKLGATVYPASNWGVGLRYDSDVIDLGVLGFAGDVADDLDSDIITVHARWFATEAMSFGLELQDGEMGDVDVEGVAITANYRF